LPVIDISSLVEQLRTSGGDSTAIEVKAAVGGLPTSIASTLSALANLPGGGMIILGLDEATGFRPVALADPAGLKAALANVGRQALEPPVGITFDDALVDGMLVVVAKVDECPVAQKPCMVRSDGKAFLRGFDGDFAMSELERQAFLVSRTHPDFDRAPVPETSRADLDGDLLADWLRTVRERQPNGLGRYADDDELLRRSGVTTTRGVRASDPPALTVAGLLALGEYPQQWFPRAVINLASMATSANGVRASAPTVVDGPIPVMLAGALAWARRTFTPLIADDGRGTVREDFEYPLAAFRELISNSLVHRDLSEWSRGYAIEVRHLADRLVITNPGGLFGITVDRLGVEGITSARNGLLVTICQFVRTTDETGQATSTRVVEALATGIPTVNASLRRRTPISKPPPVRTASEIAVWQALGSSARPLTLADLKSATQLTEATLHRVLRLLRDRGVVELQGGRGQESTYRPTTGE
jgi:ATP-dependent DNA helicase RecG